MSNLTVEITKGQERIQHLRERVKNNSFFHMTGSDVEREHFEEIWCDYIVRSEYGWDSVEIVDRESKECIRIVLHTNDD